MGPELYNIYVDKLTNMVTELTKTNILQSAQILYYERINSSLNTRVEELEKNLEKTLNKAESKSKKAEIDF